MNARLLLTGLAASWLACPGGASEPTPTTATVGGLVTDLSGAPVGGVVVAIPGAGTTTTAPDGSFATRDGRSPYGAHDMCGNVAEWVWDWYQNGYGDAPEGGWVDPTGPDAGLQRNLRGGSWRSGWTTTTFRAGWPPDYQHDYIGFRCARAAELR